jgi:4-hydroxy-tetrahydrodipicolinate synthase
MEPRGVISILPTPFTDGGAVDERSVRRLIDFQQEADVNGVAVLGFMGEAHKLSHEERRQVVTAVVDQAAGAMPTWVGVRAFGSAGAIEQAREAEQLGAAGVFVAPIDVQNDDAFHEFYASVAAAIQIPVAIHDFPDSFGTILSPVLLTRIANEIDGVTAIKLEEPPVLQKLSRILELAPGKIAVLGGLGGEYFLEELQRGASGIMTGFAFPEVLVAIYRAFDKGDLLEAACIFDRYCPLIRYEFQPKIGLAFRKHIYRQRGIFDSTFIRSPGMNLDDVTRKELDALVQRVGLSYEPGVRRL